MSSGILIAAACLVIIGALHSSLGERYLVGPLVASRSFPALLISERFAKATLRFAWHLTTFAWFAIAYMLVRGECSPWPVAVLLGASSVLTLALTGGQHAAWAIFLLGAVAVASSAAAGGLWIRAVAVVGAAALAAIGGMHVAWAFGHRVGFGAAVPEKNGAPLFVPGRAVTLVVAAGLFAAAWLLLALAHFVPAPVPASWLWVAGLVAACVFGVRTLGDGKFVGLSKRVRGTRFARFDDALYTPLCFALCTAIVLQLV